MDRNPAPNGGMAEISALNVLQQIWHHRNDQANAHGINCQR
jgi:hypothetical protein